ncbi:MAG: hypothetical protein ACQERC_12960 [Bacteroidota bacterium]
MRKILPLVLTAFALLLSPLESLSQQTSTLKLKFSLIDSDGDTIKPSDSNYVYMDYYSGGRMSLNANNHHIKYDEALQMFIATITVPGYSDYSFGLKNKESDEMMTLSIAMNGNLSEQLTLDVIQFTPGIFVFNLNENTNYYDQDDLDIEKCVENGENGRCYEIRNVDWGKSQDKQGE